MVVNNISDEITDKLLFQDRTAHKFLRNTCVKSFKIIKLQDETWKLIGFFEKISDLKETQKQPLFLMERNIIGCLSRLLPETKNS